MNRYNNDPAKAWAAYNAGPGTVDKAIKNNGDNWLSAMPQETKSYVAKNVTALNSVQQSPYVNSSATTSINPMQTSSSTTGLASAVTTAKPTQLSNIPYASGPIASPVELELQKHTSLLSTVVSLLGRSSVSSRAYPVDQQLAMAVQK